MEAKSASGCAAYRCVVWSFVSASALLACSDLSVPLLERLPTEAGDDASAPFRLRIEAEALPQNQLIQSATVDGTCFGSDQTCPVDGVAEGADCCSGGAVVTSLLGRVPCSGPPGGTGDYVDCQLTGGGVDFRDVVVPEAGTYDVTWWYHCGENNSYGDVACGGIHYSEGSSCRPQLIDVDGVPVGSALDGQMALVYQFPCYAGAWSVVHAATTELALQAGSNTIFIHAPHTIDLDGADIDALDVTLAGHGPPPLVTPVVSGD